MPELEECFVRCGVEQAVFEQTVNNSPEEVRWIQQVAAEKASSKNYITVRSNETIAIALCHMIFIIIRASSAG